MKRKTKCCHVHVKIADYTGCSGGEKNKKFSELLLSLKPLMGHERGNDRKSTDSFQYNAVLHQNDKTTHVKTLKILLKDQTAEFISA